MAMQLGERLSLTLKICLPLVILMILSASPRAYAVVDAQREARIALEMGHHQAAASALSQVVTYEPWRTTLWEQIGREEQAAGRLREAVSAFRKAEQAGVLSADGRFQLGEALLQQDDARGAEAVWQTQLKVGGPSARVFERLVQVQRTRQDFPAVVETLRAWRSFTPEDPRVAYQLGLYLSAQQPDQALPLLLEASKKDSSYTAAVQALRQGLGTAANANDPAYGWLMIGRSLGSIDQWDLAAVTFQRAVKLAPDYAEAWAFLGEANYHLNGSGKTELDQAVRLNGSSPVVRALLALYWRRQGAPDKALPYLRSIAQEEKDEPTWQVEIANTLVEVGDLESARLAYQAAVDLAPNNSIYWQYLAQFSAQYNYDVRGLGLPSARQAVLIASNDLGALDTMGTIMAYLGDAASAERFLQRAIERDATYAPALLHLGQLYLQQQDAGRARPYLKRAASLSGDNPTGKIARRLLKTYYGEGG